MGGTETPPSPDGGREGRYSSPDRRAATPGSGLAPDTPYALRTPARAEASAGASPAVRGLASSGSLAAGQQQGEFTGNLRRMTNNLMEIFDQMSNRAAAASTPAPGAPALAVRGDSVADLEGGHGDAGKASGTLAGVAATAPGTGDADSMNPAQVRRLTTSILDVLRHLQTGSGSDKGSSSGVGAEDPEIVVARHLHALSRDDGLLPDNVSELSLDDKLSLISGGTSASGKESYASLSSAGALLKDWPGFKGAEDYKGDVVHPWYVDLATGQPSGLGAPRGTSGEGGEEEEEEEEEPDYGIPICLEKQRRVNIWGTCVFFIYLAAFIFYIVIRIRYTLGLGGLLWYGVIVLLVEIIGGLAQMPYAVCLLMRVENSKPPAPDEKGVVRTLAPYHVRVLIPCYKEPLDVISKTFMAALFAPLPANCQRTVYLLDDGRDAEKRKFVHSLRVPHAVYVSGRKRGKGEMNGKSANINNCAKQLYPGDGTGVPLTEVICVFDADQVPNADFYQKMVPMLDGGCDVGMVLSPQTFYNLNPDGDIFNHSNVHFWDYTQPGYDALGLISCTGTNFLVRARAFADAGWFPEWTLTEDFALGIELKKRFWQCRYVKEYLAIGEAPEEVRNCFQQRSRWSKGHFQTFFSKHNPIIQRGLSPLMRWMYGSVILAYFSAFLGTPLLMLVPMITVWFGSFPIVINFWAAVCITVYYGATLLLNFYTHSLAHLKSMWFTSVSNSILWFAFLKAMYRATIGRYIDGSIVFKVTAKGLQRMNALPLRDVWMALLFFATMLTTLIFGLVHFSRGPASTPLVISLIFMALNLIPNYLLLQYALFRRPIVFNPICKICMLLTTFFTIFGIVLVWVLYPRSYSFTGAMSSSLTFFDTQRIGSLPSDYPISWRSSAFTQQASNVMWLSYNSTVDEANGDSTTGPAAAPMPASALVPTPGSLSPGASSPSVLSPSPSTLSPASASPSTDAFQNLVNGLTASPSPSAAAASPSPGSPSSDPFSSLAGRRLMQSNPFANLSPTTGSSPSNNLYKYPPPPPPPPPPGDSFPTPEAVKLTGSPWDLEGGFITGMDTGNMQATLPQAFSTAVLAWSYLTYGGAFDAAGDATSTLLDNLRWGTDYLLKTVQSVGTKTYILSRVGVITDEELDWYRLEDATWARPAYVVDMGKGASDLGGQVAGALAASSIVFNAAGDASYASTLLTKAQSVYAAATADLGYYSVQDWNMSTVYNSSTYYDDLAWAAGWLYRATSDSSYMSDVYSWYIKHLEFESDVSDFKYAFDWDNVFWPTNVLMSQTTSLATFGTQSETYLKSWVCANMAANYTLRGRAYNPYSAALGSTQNTAFAALAYSDVLESNGESSEKVFVYRCWALGQIRYVLGDSGRSLTVGVGKNPPTRTQDRDAACPESPAVCNRVTGLLSPEEDTHVLEGALVYGTANSDDYLDIRDSPSSRVGIENNAGYTGALAGASLLNDGMWEQCLQKYGIYRQSPICGSYINI